MFNADRNAAHTAELANLQNQFIKYATVTISNMVDLLQTKVEALLREAQAAHHRYESEKLHGVRDEQWSAWYAHHLLANGLDGLLANQTDADELGAALSELTLEQGAAGDYEDWATYMAAALVNRLSKF